MLLGSAFSSSPRYSRNSVYCVVRRSQTVNPLLQAERRIVVGHEHEGIGVHPKAPSGHPNDEVE